MQQKKEPVRFSSYQNFVILILALTQFTVILDFMVMSPLGDMMMKSLHLSPSKFGASVSAYAFSAGISGLLTAGFADKFDRKNLLLFFYIGFICGTFYCGLAHSYFTLLTARIITGLFGGVIGSISMAIVTDLFALQQRGRVMGFLQMGFGASQVLGVPIGLYLANKWGWESPFIFVGSFAVLVAVAIMLKLQPVTAHLSVQLNQSPFAHLLQTVKKKTYRIGFTSTALLSIGGFMMMPFGSAYAINNLKVTTEQLPMLFMVSGLSSLVIMPLIGRLSDKIDKYKIFAVACVWMMIMVVVYTNLSATSLWLVIALNVLMMIGIMSRMVPSSALTSAIPEMQDRGAFMSINASLQQIAGGFAAALAGIIVTQNRSTHQLQHYNIVGYVVMTITFISMILMYRVNVVVRSKISAETPGQQSKIKQSMPAEI